MRRLLSFSRRTFCGVCTALRYCYLRKGPPLDLAHPVRGWMKICFEVSQRIEATCGFVCWRHCPAGGHGQPPWTFNLGTIAFLGSVKSKQETWGSNSVCNEQYASTVSELAIVKTIMTERLQTNGLFCACDVTCRMSWPPWGWVTRNCQQRPGRNFPTNNTSGSVAFGVPTHLWPTSSS